MFGLGLVLALAASAPPAMPSAAVTCPGWPASCDGAWGAMADDAPAGSNDDGPREYATPAEIDCPTPSEAPPAAVGECSEPPLLNLWYRVSRSPDSEMPAGSLAPAPRRTRGAHLVSAGGTHDVGGHLSPPQLQPLALVALPGLAPGDGRDFSTVSTRAIPARAIAPPDRPPRA